jgi:hypothetical protein
MDRDGRVIGALMPTGIRPTFMDRLEQKGSPTVRRSSPQAMAVAATRSERSER